MSSYYGFGVTLDVPFEEAVAQVKAALQAEGFGVLTEIDVQQTLRTKLGAEMLPYRILGACNPSLAHRALVAEPEIGLLLPCNVVVRSIGEGRTTRVEIADPEVMLSIAQSHQAGQSKMPDPQAVAAEAKQRLLRVAAALSGKPVEPGVA